MSHETLPSTLYIMRSIHLRIFKLLRPTVLEEMHLQETYRQTDGRTNRQTDEQTHGRRADFGRK